MKILTWLAKKISYNSTKIRSYDSITHIVFHGTGNKNDSSKNNAEYYARWNERQAGAHFFVDKKGIIYKSVPVNRIAWSVGGSKYANCNQTGGGTYYCKCKNANSVSIELCDSLTELSAEQVKSCKELVQYLKKVCPNAKTIIRHFDVTGKDCPATMTGNSNKKWNTFLKNIKQRIEKAYRT